MENLATYYFSSVFEFSPIFLISEKWGMFAGKSQIFPNFSTKNRFHKIEKILPQTKKKQQKSLAENWALFCHLPTFMEMYLL